MNPTVIECLNEVLPLLGDVEANWSHEPNEKKGSLLKTGTEKCLKKRECSTRESPTIPPMASIKERGHADCSPPKGHGWRIAEERCRKNASGLFPAEGEPRGGREIEGTLPKEISRGIFTPKNSKEGLPAPG